MPAYVDAVTSDMGTYVGRGTVLGGVTAWRGSTPRCGGGAGHRYRLRGTRARATRVAFDVGAVFADMGAYVSHGRSSAGRGGTAPGRGRVFLGATFDGSAAH